MIKNVTTYFQKYAATLSQYLNSTNHELIAELFNDLLICQESKKQLFICGNGGSAGNAIHLANDFLYGVKNQNNEGIRVVALPANASVITCLANDISYERIYSEQLNTYANKGDILIALSGSGNSKNILEAIESAKKLGVKTYAILGFDGGFAKKIVDRPIHFNVHDMQISEDLQLIVGHILMQMISNQHKGLSKYE